MVGTSHSGNPNIIEDTKGKHTGPKTEMGKLKVSLNSLKNLNKLGKSDFKQLMEEAGVDFSKTEEAIEKVNIFKALISSKESKELTEIKRLEGMIQILNTDMSVRLMKKLEKEIPVDESDIKLIRLLKDCLSTSHEMKFGKKQLNVNASYKDIREMMFDDNP